MKVQQNLQTSFGAVNYSVIPSRLLLFLIINFHAVFHSFGQSDALPTEYWTVKNNEEIDLREAIKLLNIAKSKSTNPEISRLRARTYINLGIQYENANSYYLASDYFKKALSDIQLYMDSLKYIPSYDYLLAGNIYLKNDLYPQALKYFNKAIEMNPDNSNYYNSRAELKRTLGDEYGALKDYNSAIEKNGQDVYPLANRGRLYYEKKEFSKAIIDLEKAIQLDDEFMIAYYYLGLTYIETGKKDLGCMNLSIAGELGYFIAYDSIKELCN